ncbi:MAG TPA: serine hydrolase domain-containing protein [Ktedonobacterales bacterium]|nr:serine hydrolase domain-containing protein [Ktedonobacterales bacterium]
MEWELLDGLVAKWVEPDALHGPGVAVAVIQSGKVIYQQCRGLASLEWSQPAAPDTVFALASLTKPFTAQCMLLLEDANKLHLSDSVAPYLPNIPWLDPQITIAHLLTHTSGVANYVRQPGFWPEVARRDHTTAELAAHIGGFARDFAPSENYSYSNSGYALLGMLIEAVTGMSYSDYVRAAIFEPLGMRDSRYLSDAAVIPRRANGYERATGNAEGTPYERAPFLSHTVVYASGALGSTLNDLIRWDAALREGQFLPEGVDARMTTPLMLNDGRRLGYGLGWGLSTYRGHAVAHHAGGVPGFSTLYVRFPGDDFSLIILSNLGGFDAGGLAAAIANHALDLPEPVVQPTQAPPEQLEAAAGVYTNPNGERLEVVRLGERLALRGADTGMLTPVGNHTFALTESLDTTVRFEALASDGRFTRALVTKPFYWYVVERDSEKLA